MICEHSEANFVYTYSKDELNEKKIVWITITCAHCEMVLGDGDHELLGNLIDLANERMENARLMRQIPPRQAELLDLMEDIQDMFFNELEREN